MIDRTRWARFLEQVGPYGGLEWLGQYACLRCGVLASTAWQRADHETDCAGQPRIVGPGQLALFDA